MGTGRKKLLLLVVLLIAAGGIYFGWQQSRTEKDAMTFYGNVDVKEVSLAFRQSDRISEILVEEGQQVSKGQVLAKLDTKELELQLLKLQAEQQGQNSNVAKLHNGNRSEDIAKARERVRQMQSSRDHAQGLYERKLDIFNSVAGISQQELDK